MTQADVLARLANAPVIAAVKNADGLARAVQSDAGVVFVLYGGIMDVGGIAQAIHDAGKAAMLHIDLIDGLASRETAVEFLARQTVADGIISTKQPLVKRARELGLIGVRRFFLLDSLALQNLHRQMDDNMADFVEVLPGVMPKVLQRIVQATRLPIIAGGLISDKEDVRAALTAGAAAVSTTNPAVWAL